MQRRTLAVGGLTAEFLDALFRGADQSRGMLPTSGLHIARVVRRFALRLRTKIICTQFFFQYERLCMSQAKPQSRAAAKPKAKGDTQGYVLDDQPGFLLRVALRRHTTVFTSKMIENLTPPQFSTLAKLREVGPCSQNHLGRLVHYDSATITGVINRLRKHGLIKSYEDPLDRRRHAVDLTDKGRRIADEAIIAISQISSETFAPLSAIERRTLVQLLNKVIAG